MGLQDRSPVGIAAPRRTIVVDLRDFRTTAWWRGAASLCALCGAAISLAPGLLTSGARFGAQERIARPLVASPEANAPQPSQSEVTQAIPPHPDSMRTEEIALTGLVGGDLEGSIAATGVTAATAGKSAALVRKLVAPGRPRADDRFVLVVQYRPKARSPRAEARLLYAELRRPGEPPHRIVADQDAKVPLGAPMVAARSPRFAPAFPVRGRITSGFGWRRHPILRGLRLHRGIDIAAPSGSVVRAAGSGQVVWTGWNGGYGNQVRVRHPGGTISSYSHLRAIAVRAGSAVAQGQPIGRVGATGLATGPHLHYELVRGGVPFEPKAAMLTDEGGPQTAATAAEREYRRLRSLPRFSSIADWRARRGRAQPE